MGSIRFKNNRLFYLDQTKLPLQELWRECKSLGDGYKAIKDLRIRGAPLIGVFATYSVFIASKKFSSQKEKFLKQLKEAIAYLKTSRPTAVNLFWALQRLILVVKNNQKESIFKIKSEILKEAKDIHAEDIDLCRKMAGYGVKLIKKGDRILTHCNTGFLATSGDGTALAVIYKAHRLHKNIRIYADETRPLLQGSRLTAWELDKRKIPSTVICDNMAASLMQERQIDKIFLGADRIAANGDTANKIGTYSLAVLAHYHKIPFYVVAPFSTFDLKLKSGKFIPIEKRCADEVRKVLGKVYITPRHTQVQNPAFDITPNKLITAIVSDKGVIYPPFRKNIKKVISRKP